ncbi:MAG: TfoX/Sxy family protein [Pseudorhodoplanes sp.]
MDHEYLRDLFVSFRPVTVRRMFGGAGIFVDGVMFGLVVDDVIYLKAGEDNAPDFDREDLPPFRYQAKNGKRAVMSYRKMPERLYDDPDELAQWASRSLAIAQRKAIPKQKAAQTGRHKTARRKTARRKTGRHKTGRAAD